MRAPSRDGLWLNCDTGVAELVRSDTRVFDSCFNGDKHRKAGDKPITPITPSLRSEVAYPPLYMKGSSDPLHGSDKRNPLRFNTGTPAGWSKATRVLADPHPCAEDSGSPRGAELGTWQGRLGAALLAVSALRKNDGPWRGCLLGPCGQPRAPRVPLLRSAATFCKSFSVGRKATSLGQRALAAAVGAPPGTRGPRGKRGRGAGKVRAGGVGHSAPRARRSPPYGKQEETHAALARSHLPTFRRAA